MPRNKTDKNQAEIVKALRKIPGVSVETNHDDLLIGHKGVTRWYEVKNPNEIRKDGTPYNRKRSTAKKQKKLDEEFTGHYRIVSTLDEILRDMGID